LTGAGKAVGKMSLASLLRIDPGSSSSEPLLAGSYVTDGQALYRVLSQFATVGDDVLASLEDCRTLEVHAYAPGELSAMRLRTVRRGESR
jgi:hypothetical protein